MAVKRVKKVRKVRCHLCPNTVAEQQWVKLGWLQYRDYQRDVKRYACLRHVSEDRQGNVTVERLNKLIV